METDIKKLIQEDISKTGELPDADRVLELSGFSQLEIQKPYEASQIKEIKRFEDLYGIKVEILYKNQAS